MKVCFFARVSDRRILEDIGYYREDLEILRELGCEIFPATCFREIPWGCDLYFTWWYGWGIVALIKSKLARKPNVMVGPIHYHDSEYGFLRRPKWEQWLIQLSLRLADAAVTVSEIELEGIRALGAKHPFMVHHSVPAPATVRSFEQREPLAFSIGHLCSIGIARKRFDNVIRAVPYVLEKFPAMRFVVAGRAGRGFEHLEALCHELGIRAAVEFPGAINDREKAEYLERASVMVQPARYEGFGLAQLEAMSHGLPVVTSEGGAVREVTGECALFCNPAEPKDIAKNICRVLSDPMLWNRLSEAGRHRAQSRFPRKARREKLAEILRHVCARFQVAEVAGSPNRVGPETR
jgi:glycosyltransferase involved in cell wall biosynthesis